MSVIYTYSVSADFQVTGISPGQLFVEIQDSAIVPLILSVLVTGDVVDIYFDSSLSIPTETDILDALVAAHVPSTTPVLPDTTHGEIYANTLNEFLITSADTWVQWNGTTEGLTSDDVTYASNALTLDGSETAGIYLTDFSFTVNGVTDKEFTFAVFVNDTLQSNIIANQDTHSGITDYSVSANGLLSLVNTDTVDVRIQSTTAGNTLNIIYGNLRITKVDVSQGPAGEVGITWKGTWNSGANYNENDVVYLDGTSYICTLGHSNQTPPNATYWDILAAQGGVENTIILEEEGFSVSGGPHDTMNFIGANVTVTDAGSNVADIKLDMTDIDAFSPGTMLIGKSIATKLELAKTGVDTEIKGPLQNLSNVFLNGAGTYIQLTEGADPGNSAGNTGRLYAKIDGHIYWRDDDNNEFDLTTGTGGGSGIVAYNLLQLAAVADKTTWTTVSYFNWYHSRYSSYTNGTLIFYVTVPDAGSPIEIRLYDITNAVSLNVSTPTYTSDGMYSFGVNNPIGNAQLALQIISISAGGPKPRLYGVTLEYNS